MYEGQWVRNQRSGVGEQTLRLAPGLSVRGRWEGGGFGGVGEVRRRAWRGGEEVEGGEVIYEGELRLVMEGGGGAALLERKGVGRGVVEEEHAAFEYEGQWGRDSCLKPASALSEDIVPFASQDHWKARATPTHPRAQPRHLGSSPWPQQPASGRPKVAGLSTCNR